LHASGFARGKRSAVLSESSTGGGPRRERTPGLGTHCPETELPRRRSLGAHWHALAFIGAISNHQHDQLRPKVSDPRPRVGHVARLPVANCRPRGQP
jgi:hypothetical protein